MKILTKNTISTIFIKFIITIIIIFSFSNFYIQATLANSNQCSNILNDQFTNTKSKSGLSESGISEQELTEYVYQKIVQVPEFEYIRETAKKMGLRVWLFGGTASSFLHYVKWDLTRIKGIKNLQQDRFDYDFTNIFRSTQDLDIVVDANPELANKFQNTIAEKFPHFLGSKANKWEVRTLRNQIGKPGQPGFKEALLNDIDFNNQNTDSNSLGMVEISQSKEPIVRDLKYWNNSSSVFLKDTINNHISFFRNKNHFTTTRAKVGENPEILSVIRLLVKAFQYELNISKSDFDEMKMIINEFDAHQVNNTIALRRIHDTAKKLIIHAVNMEYAINKLDELGLRQKLISLGNKNEEDSDAWWLNREPLRSKKIGQGFGRTASSLNIKEVAHETNSFMAYESITRSHSGEPNVLISRQNTIGESAAFGDGFYTRIGKEGARGTGLTIRFYVDPNAREGTDFTVNNNYIVFKNKKALRVIQESLNFSLADLLKLAENNQELKIEYSDLALLEKLKRKLNASIIMDELDKLLNSKLESDEVLLIHILNSFQQTNIEKLISKDVLNSVFENVYNKVKILAQSPKEIDILRYIKTISPILKALNTIGILNQNDFLNYLSGFIHSHSTNLNLKREVVFELLLFSENFEQYFNFTRDLDANELKTLVPEIKDWHNSQDPRKKRLAIELNEKWSEAIMYFEVNKLRDFIDSQLFDINYKNISQVSMLQLAAYYKQKRTINWLIANPDFDFNLKNKFGFNEVEQLRLSGRAELADEIERQRPEIRAQRFSVKARNTEDNTSDYPNGTPIIDFVQIEAGSFMMGDKEKILTTISRPFEVMSVDITQETYRTVVELLKQNFHDEEFIKLNATPAYFQGEHLPVESVSYNDVSIWIKGLNELSKLEKVEIQIKLEKLFPGHKLGQTYNRPTEAQWEFISRLGGLAESDYAHGKGLTDLAEYAVFYENPNSTIQPVGSKKPVFYNGKPIYDLKGNVWKWLEDWYDQNLTGGIDPIGGPESSRYRVIRGGSWGNAEVQGYHSGYRFYVDPSVFNISLGFRLIRTSK
jgi:formylglycine-generating enzyme required for sulfatase activity